uniref:RXYLT1 C-terminal domain-containing protein n=1 Tax=viral metagenome TaxID=1070528 RepID=A0A6C0AYH5_9ZZZZ|tara:strand:+ start:708 stop:1565 length:858 start_codon:yes stop_codon:yes gene_type:complete
MQRFLFLNNKDFFDKHNIYTVKNINDIPNCDSILFIGIHNNDACMELNKITKYFPSIEKRAQYKYIILMGKGNGIINSNIHIPSNIKYIFCNYIPYYHDIIKFYPLGTDYRSKPFNHLSNENNNNDILCYANFSLKTHKDRKSIFNIIKNKTFITKENIQNELNHTLDFNTFFKKLTSSRFVICPRGFNPDSWRFYDAIYSGAIPITVKESFHNTFYFKNIPILFLNNINEFNLLTPEFLEEKYEELKCLKSNYYKNLDFEVFMTRLKRLFLDEDTYENLFNNDS